MELEVRSKQLLERDNKKMQVESQSVAEPEPTFREQDSEPYGLTYNLLQCNGHMVHTNNKRAYLDTQMHWRPGVYNTWFFK